MERGRFRHILRRLRIKNKLSTRELASYLGCSHVWIIKLEQGKVKPTRKLLLRLANYFNVDPVELFNQCKLPLPSNKEILEERVRVDLCDSVLFAIPNPEKLEFDDLIAKIRIKFGKAKADQIIKKASKGQKVVKVVRSYFEEYTKKSKGFSMEGLLRVAEKPSLYKSKCFGYEKKTYKSPIRTQNNIYQKKPSPKREKTNNSKTENDKSDDSSDGDLFSNYFRKIKIQLRLKDKPRNK